MRGVVRLPDFIMKMNLPNNEIVLQKKVTLDDAVLSSSTFPNGCDWAFYFEPDGSVYMGYGCYGVMINLVTDKRKMLLNWFIDNTPKTRTDTSPFRVRLPIHAETIRKLKARQPCDVCGQPYFRNVGDESPKSRIYCQPSGRTFSFYS